MEIVNIDIKDIIDNPYQPRKTINENDLKDLMNSISQIGLLQPIVVNRDLEGNNILIAGQRRLMVFNILAKGNQYYEKIPAFVIASEISKDSLAIAAIVENIQREDISDYDLSYSLNNLKKEFGWNNKKISDFVGKSESWVSKTLSVLNLSEMVIEDVKNGTIDFSKAKVLASSKLSIKEQENFSNLAKDSTKENLENVISNYKKTNIIKFNENKKDPNIVSVENNLIVKYGSIVRIDKNKIIIKFKDDKDLNRILEIMGYKFGL